VYTDSPESEYAEYLSVKVFIMLFEGRNRNHHFLQHTSEGLFSFFFKAIKVDYFYKFNVDFRKKMFFQKENVAEKCSVWSEL